MPFPKTKYNKYVQEAVEEQRGGEQREAKVLLRFPSTKRYLYRLLGLQKYTKKGTPVETSLTLTVYEGTSYLVTTYFW
jgi:hypothetical protein